MGGGGQNNMRGGSPKIKKKINVPPVYFEPESRTVSPMLCFQLKLKRTTHLCAYICFYI